VLFGARAWPPEIIRNGRGLIQTGRIELSLDEAQGAAQMCSSQIGMLQVRIVQLGSGEIRTPGIRSAQNSFLQIGLDENGLAEVGLAQVASYQAGQLQIRLAQLSL
jgi:hypothetical protein